MLSVAIEAGDLAATACLIEECGFDPNAICRKADRARPLHVSVSVNYLAGYRDFPRLEMVTLLKADVNGLDAQKRTPLHVLTQYPLTEMRWQTIHALLEAGAQADLKDCHGHIPRDRIMQNYWAREVGQPRRSRPGRLRRAHDQLRRFDDLVAETSQSVVQVD